MNAHPTSFLIHVQKITTQPLWAIHLLSHPVKTYKERCTPPGAKGLFKFSLCPAVLLCSLSCELWQRLFPLRLFVILSLSQGWVGQATKLIGRRKKIFFKDYGKNTPIEQNKNHLEYTACEGQASTRARRMTSADT